MAGWGIDAQYKETQKMYEAETDIALAHDKPVILRLDGKSFGKYYRYFQKPYDPVLHNAMAYTLRVLCENIPECKFGYRVSDEISLLLIPPDDKDTPRWYSFRVQKMCSIAASMATLAFRNGLIEEVDKIRCGYPVTDYEKAIQKGAMFDCRCFTVQPEQIADYFIWRQELSYAHTKQWFYAQKQKGMFTQAPRFQDMPLPFQLGDSYEKKNEYWLLRHIRFKDNTITGESK